MGWENRSVGHRESPEKEVGGDYSTTSFSFMNTCPDEEKADDGHERALSWLGWLTNRSTFSDLKIFNFKPGLRVVQRPITDLSP